MNKLRDSTPLSRPDNMPKIRIRYEQPRMKNGVRLSFVITLILAFVFLHEQFTVKSLVGCVLIAAGTLIMVI